MNKQLKQRIQKAFEAPTPNHQDKAKFIKTLPRPKISMLKFILIQATYIRKTTLLLSVLLLLPALSGVYHVNPNTLWMVSAFIPLLGLLAVLESTRSMMYGMEEFEISTRFSLKSVVLARMSVLGLLDFFVFCCLIPLCCISSKTSFLQTGLYLFVPYLLTANLCLWLTRRFPNKETIYVCMCVTLLISSANILLHFLMNYVYHTSYIGFWILLFILLTVKMIHEIYYTTKQTEELVWNSSLTD